MTPSIGLMVVRSPLEVGAEQAPEIVARASEIFAGWGMIAHPALVDSAPAARAAAADWPAIDALCVIAATWSEDYLVQDVLAELPVPVIAWGLPGVHTGSLCGTQQLCCVLKELGYPYRFVYGALDDPAAGTRVRDAACGAALIRALRGSRVGRIGGRLAGMAEVAVDELELRARFGIRLVERGLDWLQEAVAGTDSETAERDWQRICARAGSVQVPATEGLTAMRYYQALTRFVREEALCALTVECYPALMGRVCLPFSLLAEEDIVGACEGDVNAAVAMRMMAWLSGRPVHNTDLLADTPDNAVIFSHCGSGALCLAANRAEIALQSCRLMDVGVTAHFPGRPGRVTLLNLVGRRDSYRLGVITGVALPTEMVFPGNPVKVRLDVPIAACLDDIAEVGLGHHWMIAEGDLGGAVDEFGRLLHLPVYHPGV